MAEISAENLAQAFKTSSYRGCRDVREYTAPWEKYWMNSSQKANLYVVSQTKWTLWFSLIYWTILKLQEKSVISNLVILPYSWSS